MRRLNNFVTELAREDAATEVAFSTDRAGWVHISCDGPDSVTKLDDAPVVSREIGGRREIMAWLPAGPHGFSASAKLGNISIRRVPQLMHCQYGANPHIPEFGPYDWNFLAKWVLPHINSMVASGGQSQVEQSAEWKRLGGRWIVERGMPAPQDRPADPEQVAQTLAAHILDEPTKPDGVLVDEFFSGNYAAIPGFIESFRLLAADERLRGTAIYPYVGGQYPATNDWREGDPDAPDNSRHLYRACFDAAFPGGERGSANWWISWERYLHEHRYAEDAVRHMDIRMGEPMQRWREFYPDAQRHMMIALGYLTVTESVDHHPSVDFKVFMDMEFQYLATRKDFDGLAGLYEYLSSYADEESVRWAPRLLRHYCIEGNTGLLGERLGWRYNPDIIRNPDFEYDWESWEFEIIPQERTMQVVSHHRYSFLQGRWPGTRVGDTMLVMRRRAEAPNTISQKLWNVVPGQYYSVRLITGDYGALTKGLSVRDKHGVRVLIDGDAEIVPAQTFQAVVPNNYSHTLEPFTAQYNYYFNWHVVVFKATGPDIRLHITDWLSDDAPGAPVGQEIAYNGIQAQPWWPGDGGEAV